MAKARAQYPAGPCLVCGHPDKRHRMWDAIRDRFLAGESLAALARDYAVPQVGIELWLRLAMIEQRRRRA